jgi:hypothetical protein
MIEKSGRSTATILTLHTYLQRNPISNTTKMKKTCDLALPSIMRALKTLEELCKRNNGQRTTQDFRLQ